MYNLKNKTSVITGASKGIGKNIALNLAKNGSDVYLISRTLKDLNKVESLIKNNYKVNVKCFAIDTSNLQSVQEAINSIILETGKIDVLVNNAGITKDNILLKMSENDWKEVIDINSTSIIATMADEKTFQKEFRESLEK